MIAATIDAILFITARSSSWPPPGEEGEPLQDQDDREREPGALELPPAVEHEAQEAHHLVQAHARLEAVSLLWRIAARVHVRLEEPGAHPLAGLVSVRRCRSPCLARGQAQVGEELAEVERWLRLADGVEVDQPALGTGEDQLRGAEVPVAEARRPGVRRCRTCGYRVEPLLEPGGEAGGDPFQDGERLRQRARRVVGAAAGSEPDARGVETPRNARGPV